MYCTIGIHSADEKCVRSDLKLWAVCDRFVVLVVDNRLSWRVSTRYSTCPGVGCRRVRVRWAVENYSGAVAISRRIDRYRIAGIAARGDRRLRMYCWRPFYVYKKINGVYCECIQYVFSRLQFLIAEKNYVHTLHIYSNARSDVRIADLTPAGVSRLIWHVHSNDCLYSGLKNWLNKLKHIHLVFIQL